jgi:hypothetical protein
MKSYILWDIMLCGQILSSSSYEDLYLMGYNDVCGQLKVVAGIVQSV